MISTIMIDREQDRRALAVHAYGPVLDLDQGCGIASFYDYAFSHRRASHWRIHKAEEMSRNRPGAKSGFASVAANGVGRELHASREERAFARGRIVAKVALPASAARCTR